MSAAGSWNLEVDTPMGKKTGTLDLKVDGDLVTGTSTAEGETDPVLNGKIVGSVVTFEVKVSKPFPMTMAFEFTVDGDALLGHVAIGMFGKAPVAGARA